MPNSSLNEKIESAIAAVLVAGSVTTTIYKGTVPEETPTPKIEVVVDGGEEIEIGTGIFRKAVQVRVTTQVDEIDDRGAIVSSVSALLQVDGVESDLTADQSDFHVYQFEDKGTQPEEEGRLKSEVLNFEIVATQKDLV